MAERHPCLDPEQVLGGCQPQHPKAERPSRPEEHGGVANRFGRRQQQQQACVFRKRIEPFPEPSSSILDETGNSEPAGNLRRRKNPR